MITSSVRLQGPNNFACIGIATLLSEISTTLPKSFPTSLMIIVLTRMALWEITKYCQQLDPTGDYIILGDTQVRELLSGNRSLKVVEFIDVGLPLPHLRYTLQKVLSSPKLKLRKAEPLTFTPREQVVLKYLIRGMNSVQTARLIGISEKTISTYKRSVMNKLQVSSNPTLYCKLILIQGQAKLDIEEYDRGEGLKCHEI